MCIDHLKVSIISKTGDLDLQAQIGLLNLQNISFELSNFFAFTHKLFIDHMKVLDKFETSDLDLDL